MPEQAAQATAQATQAVVELSYFEWFVKFMVDGGIFMWVIAAVWVVGVVICVERWLKYRLYYVDGPSMMGQVKKFVLANQLSEAIQYTTENKALLSHVLKNGLKRAGQPKDQVQDALEGTILEVVPHIERRLTTISLMANVSTLFGLLGTIQGLIQSFAAVAGADPAQKGQLLAEGIAVAMNTTALGLVSAISLMFAHAYLAGKGEGMIKQIEENAVKLLDLLGAKKAFGNSDRVA
jgi:biopolymer transport protein ExbB